MKNNCNTEFCKNVFKVIESAKGTTCQGMTDTELKAYEMGVLNTLSLVDTMLEEMENEDYAD